MAGPASPREQLPTSRPPRHPTGAANPRTGACPAPRGAAAPQAQPRPGGAARSNFSVWWGADPCTTGDGDRPLGGRNKVGVSRPVSRVLSGGLPLRDGHSSGAPLARRLEQPTRAAAGIEPGALGALPRHPGRPYSVLLPVGFAVPPPLPEARCALTAPFHPCLRVAPRGRFVFCGTFPGVAPGGR